MESLSRYHLDQDENGTWHVVDARTKGPVEIQVDGKLCLLWEMAKADAETWSILLNQFARRRH